MKIKTITIIGIEIILIMAIIVIVNSNYISYIPNCWIYENTGIQCFSCGATRCIENIVKGNWLQAFQYHSVLFLTLMYLGIINILYLINRNRKEKIGTKWYPNQKIGIIFVLGLVVYTILRNLL